jgi:hypothetical protein
MDSILDFISEFWQGLTDLLTASVNTFFDMLGDFWLFLFDMVLDGAIGLLDTTGTAFTFNPATYISALPTETVNIIGLLGIGECTTIIVAAITIRFLLQLIPFVRWGS